MSRHCFVALVITLTLLSARPSMAWAPNSWATDLDVRSGGLVGGFVLGSTPNSVDGYDGQWPDLSSPVDIELDQYRLNGAGWTGPSGFYSWNFEAPIPAYGSKTWSDLYLWAQGVTLDPPNRVQFRSSSEPHGCPQGYFARVVLDYIPLEANWTGPAEWWLDLSKTNQFELPVVTVTDPLQGVRMHITVYSTVPEPASLAALLAGLTGLGGLAFRRRRG